MGDYFKDFKGFGIGFLGRFQTFYREEPVETASRLLGRYPGEKVEVEMNVSTDDGILEREEHLVVPLNGMDGRWRGIKTDYIRIKLPVEHCEKEGVGSYVIQRIVIGEQQGSQVESYPY